jgi:hypothetical protein
MSPDRELRDPIGEAVDLVMRTLRVLYIAFWGSLIVYALVLLVFLPLTRTEEPARAALPTNWPQWQLFFGIAGIALLYLSQRLRGALIDPKQIHKRILRSSGETAPSAVNALTQGMARIVSGHVFLWCIVEVPALLGVIDRLMSGEVRYLAVLCAMSAAGLFQHRPRRDRVEASFAGLRGTVLPAG